jgi:uncharacterized protein (TIGR03663 family)
MVLIIFGAGFLRLSDLKKRPMHTDEAVNAVKFGELLEKGTYKYDKVEYHGPIIYYFTLLPAWITHIKQIEDLNEKHLRIIPVIAGLGLLLLLLLIRPFIGWQTVLSVILIGAISPAMVFFSRYYIHEMLLVFFTYGFIITFFLFLRRRVVSWLVLSGLFLGLMHTTKETFIIAVGVFFLAVISFNALWKDEALSVSNIFRSFKWYHYILLLGIAGLVSVFFFSSFFKNPQGIIDSVTTYKNYFSKAGRNEIHHHPWYYYLKVLVWNKGPGHIIWSELPILILACIGIGLVSIHNGITDRIRFLRIIGISSILLLIIYSVIPYKTPWNMLSFYFGIIIMAGYGARELLIRFNKSRQMILLWITFVVAASHLISQDVFTNYKYPAHPSNPYVYGHSAMDIITFSDRIKEVAKFHPDKNDMYIQVAVTENDYWPLPWYLRDYKNIGWWDHVDFNTPLAPLIIVSPDLEKSLITKMYELPKPGEKYLYIPLFDRQLELRPGVKIHGYVRSDYWGF